MEPNKIDYVREYGEMFTKNGFFREAQIKQIRKLIEMQHVTELIRHYECTDFAMRGFAVTVGWIKRDKPFSDADIQLYYQREVEK